MTTGQGTGIEVLEARAAIADLVHGYARNVREGNGAACGRLFADDASFEIRQAPSFGSPSYTTRSTILGRDAISAYIAKSAAPEARVCPSISNLLIDVAGAEASSTCVMTILGMPDGQQMLGEYHDTYRNQDGWRFSGRVFTIVGDL